MAPDRKAFTEYTEQNRRAWNEIADDRAAQREQAAFFQQGGSTLDTWAIEAAGDVRGLALLHLQCSTGEDAISWTLRGARVTGVDISDRQIEIARRKAEEVGVEVRFMAADVYDLPPDLQTGTCDIVFTGGGSVVYLPDLAPWAEAIVAALKPGGRLLLAEEHPVAACLAFRDDRLVIDDDYFGRGRPLPCGPGWFHFRVSHPVHEPKYEFAWPLGDVVTALAQGGLRIEALHEYPSQAAWRFGDRLEEVRRLPGEYLLIARR
ncbi:MAG: class I SAM-dependent methyltransferase [Anaerolineae bacterium]